MANYKVGDIIRLTRKSVGMSQEEIAFLAELTPETISRIESGKHKITQNTYRKIMSILKRFSNQNYAICTGKDVGIIDEKKLLEEAEIKFEYKEAEKHLNNLKEQIGDNIIDLQYVLRAETLLDYYNHKIVAETMVKNLEEALKLTLVDWDIHSNFYMSENEVYPFTEQEILVLMNLSGAYNECGNPEMSEKISNMILKCLNAEYLKSDETENLKLVIKRNLALACQHMKRYEDALSLLQEILKQAITLKYGLMVILALYDITWNMQKINEISGCEKYNWNEIKKKKLQVYYIAAARGDNYIKNLVAKSYRKLFDEDIEI